MPDRLTRRPAREVALPPDVAEDLAAAGVRGVTVTRAVDDASDLTVRYVTPRTGARLVAVDALSIAELLWLHLPVPIASLALRPRAAHLQLVLVRLAADRLREWFGDPAHIAPATR